MIRVAHVARMMEEILWENLTKREHFKICDLYWRLWTEFESECRQVMGFCETSDIIKGG
jgi:hypothetical protein